MKVKLFSLFLVLSVLFFSCSGGTSQNTEGSISLDAGRVASYLSRNISNNRSASRSAGNPFIDFMIYEMTIKASTVGDYNTSTSKKFTKKITDVTSEKEYEDALTEFVKKASGTPLTLEGIPVYSKIKVKVILSFGAVLDEEQVKEFYRDMGASESEIAAVIEEMNAWMAEDEDSSVEIVEASSDEFIVKTGVNTVTIRFTDSFDNPFEANGDEAIDVPIILYSKIQQIPEGEKTEIYVSENGTKSLLVDETEGFINSCKDNNGYVYILYKKFTELYGTDCFFVYSNNPNFPDEDVWLSTNSEEGERIAYDSVENKIYTYCNRTESDPPFDDDLIIRYYPNLINDGSTDGAVEYVCEGFFNDFYTADLFAVNNKTAFVARRTMDSYNRVNSLPIYAFNLPNGSELDINDAEEIIDLFIDANWSYINDTYYADGYLYMLVADKMEKFGNNDHYGGLVRLNIQDKEAETFLSPESYDIQAYSEDGFYYPIPLNQPTDIESKAAFFCPRKIIGIKPKRLIIADDGFFVYKDEDDDDKPHFKNVNRVVMVNLEKYPIEINRVDVMTDVNFSGDETSLTCGATGFEGSDTVICDD